MVRGMGIVMSKGSLFMDDGVEIINRALFQRLFRGSYVCRGRYTSRGTYFL